MASTPLTLEKVDFTEFTDREMKVIATSGLLGKHFANQDAWILDRLFTDLQRRGMALQFTTDPSVARPDPGSAPARPAGETAVVGPPPPPASDAEPVETPTVENVQPIF